VPIIALYSAKNQRAANSMGLKPSRTSNRNRWLPPGPLRSPSDNRAGCSRGPARACLPAYGPAVPGPAHCQPDLSGSPPDWTFRSPLVLLHRESGTYVQQYGEADHL
jgi:hypothetical protein